MRRQKTIRLRSRFSSAEFSQLNPFNTTGKGAQLIIISFGKTPVRAAAVQLLSARSLFGWSRRKGMSVRVSEEKLRVHYRDKRKLFMTNEAEKRCLKLGSNVIPCGWTIFSRGRERSIGVVRLGHRSDLADTSEQTRARRGHR